MCFSRYFGRLLILLLSQQAIATEVLTDVSTLGGAGTVTEVTPEVSSAAVQLNITPDTCVSLQQGRICYSTVVVSWHSEQVLDLCLELDDEILQCWTQQSQGEHQFEFASPQTSVVRLLRQQQAVAQAQIKVNWVHKASKVKRHWRLF